MPQGYLRLLVFNRDSALVGQQVQQLTQAALGGYEPLRLQVVLPQDGYVTAYVGTESDVDVFFDDVTVEHRPGLHVQEVQYDAAGLELAGLAPPSPGIRGLNNYRFNGKEFQADLGLNWNHQDWRLLDPTTLRWNGLDPELENGQESWSPYAFGFDNAVRYADANGREPSEGDPPITVASIIKSTFYGLAASVANTALAAADYTSPGGVGIARMMSGQSYRAVVGADGISYEQRPAVTSERQAWGYIGADGLDMASTAITVATMGEGAAVGRSLPMATGLLLEQGAGKVAQNEAVQEGKALIRTKGAFTEPKLPSKTVAQGNGVEVVHYTKSGDHGPPHLHVIGGGPETRIGQAGKPLVNNPALTSKQQAVIKENKSAIRKAVDQIGRYVKFQNL